jgi:hypothetical protein
MDETEEAKQRTSRKQSLVDTCWFGSAPFVLGHQARDGWMYVMSEFRTRNASFLFRALIDPFPDLGDFMPDIMTVDEGDEHQINDWQSSVDGMNFVMDSRLSICMIVRSAYNKMIPSFPSPEAMRSMHKRRV